MKSINIILKRELAAYFATPVAYIFIIIFLMLSGVFTFYLGRFYEQGQADLSSFFNFIPWLYLVLVPAVAMRLWSEDELRSVNAQIEYVLRDALRKAGRLPAHVRKEKQRG